jgi:hypothetical protein
MGCIAHVTGFLETKRGMLWDWTFRNGTTITCTDDSNKWKNPKFIFWDAVHPSSSTYRILFEHFEKLIRSSQVPVNQRRAFICVTHTHTHIYIRAYVQKNENNISSFAVYITLDRSLHVPSLHLSFIFLQCYGFCVRSRSMCSQPLLFL